MLYKLIKTQKLLYLLNLVPPKLNSLLNPNTQLSDAEMKPTCSSQFSVHHLIGVKLLVRLRLGFSHLCEHKFRHNLHNTLNPLCSCSVEPETTSHYLLLCHNFSSTRLAFRNDLNLIGPTITQLNEAALASILLYGDAQKKTA